MVRTCTVGLGVPPLTPNWGCGSLPPPLLSRVAFATVRSPVLLNERTYSSSHYVTIKVLQKIELNGGLVGNRHSDHRSPAQSFQASNFPWQQILSKFSVSWCSAGNKLPGFQSQCVPLVADFPSSKLRVFRWQQTSRFPASRYSNGSRLPGIQLLGFCW